MESRFRIRQHSMLEKVVKVVYEPCRGFFPGGFRDGDGEIREVLSEY
jgi:hypothetical protein